jgi:DNA-binding NarL/FixJ family response regulator
MTSAPAPVRTVRIVLVALRGLLRDLIRQILATERGLHVVGELTDGQALSATLDRTRADLVIWNFEDGDEAEDASTWSGLLDNHPRVAILTVRDDGRRGSVWQLRPHMTAIGELSPRLLLDAIREAVRR